MSGHAIVYSIYLYYLHIISFGPMGTDCTAIWRIADRRLPLQPQTRLDTIKHEYAFHEITELHTSTYQGQCSMSGRSVALMPAVVEGAT